jgi:hypothetical protein
MLASVCAVAFVITIVCGATVQPRVLPNTILAGYPGNGYTDNGTPNEAVLEAARNGVNVVIWNDITMGSDPQTGLIPRRFSAYIPDFSYRGSVYILLCSSCSPFDAQLAWTS